MQTTIRRSTAQRRHQIARAVLEIIEKKGIAAFTTTTLAREVGVTSGALFRHFESRDEMLLEAVRYAATKIDATFPDDTLPAEDRLLRFARDRVRLLRSEPGIVWLLTTEQARLALSGDAVALLEERIQRSRRFVLDALREGAAQGTIRNDIKPSELLVLVMGTIHALRGVAGASQTGTTTHSRNTNRILSALMKMIAPDSSHKRRTRTKKGESKK